MARPLRLEFAGALRERRGGKSCVLPLLAISNDGVSSI